MIDWTPGVYRWRQISNELARRIETGDYRPGFLISENAVMQEFGVARATARRAISDLRARSLIFTRRNLGSFVGQDPEAEI